MPATLIGEIIAEVLHFTGRVLAEVVVELAIRGLGRLLLHLVRPRHEPSEGAVLFVGILAWIGLLGLAFWLM